MDVSRLAAAVGAAASVAVGVAGGYLVTRATGPADPAMRPAAVEVAAAADRPAVAVEHSEALVVPTPEPVEAERAPAAIPGRPRPVPQAARQAAPRPVPAPVRAPAHDEESASAVAVPSPPAAPVAADVPAPVAESAAPVAIEPIVTAPPSLDVAELVVAEDAVIGLQVETAVSSETALVEDQVVARVARDVRVGGQVAIPAGSRAHGEVVLVERGGKMRERARLGVRFTSITLADGTRLPISAEPIYREGEAPGRESATKIGGGAIGGAIIGGILGGAKGAAIGGSIGAGAGSAVVLAGSRNPATLSAGSPVTIRLEAPATVVVPR